MKKQAISEQNKEINIKRANKILNFISRCREKNIETDITSSQSFILSEVVAKGYISSFYKNAIVDFTEYSPQCKEIKYASIKKGFFSNSHNNSESSSENSSESSSDSSSESSSESSSDSSNNAFCGETAEEQERNKRDIALQNTSYKIRSAIKSNINKLNQYQILNATFTTSEEYQTTDIKAFCKMLDNYFKLISDKLHSVTVTHIEDEIKRTYTYENFSLICVISCTKRGYLHCHCLMIFEGVITKIAPQKTENGGVGFNFADNVIKDCWQFGNVHIKHYLNGLTQFEINKIADYFVKNYKDIRQLKDMSDVELRETAEEKIIGYINENGLQLEQAEIESLKEECYANLCSLREQQADGKRNRLFQQKRTVLKEDLTVLAEYGQAKEYTKGMTLKRQEIKFRCIKIDGVYKLQISLTETYEDECRTYDNSLNMLDKEYYRKVQRQRRQPVLVQQPIQQLQQPQQLITPQEQPADCYDDEYDNYNDYDGYFESVALSEEEEVYLPYANEEDILMYEEMGLAVMSKNY